MKEWKIKNNPTALLEKLGSEIKKKYSPVVLELLLNRGIDTEEKINDFFDFDYEKNILDPLSFPEMKKAVERLEQAQKNKEKIAIFGDYDADGVTATSLLYEALKDLDFDDVIFYIPDRQTEGYGINEEAVDYLIEQKVNLIVTVDCGISNQPEVVYAQKKGLEIIVTDHHHIPEKIPACVAVINPQIANSYAFPQLAGVGVAFKLAQALYQKLAPEKIDQLKWALDLVAIGTIADCVPLLGENRVLTKFGLIVLEKTRRVGIQELFQVAGIKTDDGEEMNAHKIAFQISPRINAAGRMDHANISYNLIVEKDRVKARTLALELESKNKERQKVTEQIVREISVLAENSFKDKKFIVASNPHWSVGILGLIAGRISDKFNKPTLVIQEKEGEDWVGSLRSVPELNIVEVLEECKEFLIKFGGHSQAAGLSIAKEQMENFYNKFSEIIEEKLAQYKAISILEIDKKIEAKDIDWPLMQDIKKLEPFGEGNKEPVFLLENIVVEEINMVGNGQKHLKLWLRKEKLPKVFEAIGFGLGEDWLELKKNDKIDTVFTLEEDEWNGNKKIQLKLIDLKRSNS